MVAWNCGEERIERFFSLEKASNLIKVVSFIDVEVGILPY